VEAAAEAVSAKVWIDGRPIDAEQAKVSVFDRGFLYGDSIYEVLRVFAGRPFMMAEHLQRLAASAAGLAMAIPPLGEIERAVHECLAAAAEPEAYVRIMITRGAGEIGLDPQLADAPRLIVIVRRVHPPGPEVYRDGVDVAIVGRSRVDPAVKSGNYLVSVMAVAEARRRGAHEAILSDHVGRIVEGGSSNFFLVRGRRLCTPPLSAGILEGITRRAVIALCRADGIAVDEVPLWPIDLVRADGAFLTSSVRGVVPVTRIDGQPLAQGTVPALVRRVMALYDARTRQ
jgi:branched-chain amino acid aminotransferase